MDATVRLWHSARVLAYESKENVVDGRLLKGSTVNETAVRAAAGLTMVLGGIAFALALLSSEFRPLKVVTTFFAVEFLVRVTLGFRRSPLGVVTNALVAGLKAEWVSEAPKRFAWTLGLVMALMMSVITNLNIRGSVPFTFCVVCLTLMWLESSLGYCMGCHIYGVLVRRGVIKARADYEICANGECRID